MLDILKHAHSGLRWVVLVLLIITVILSLSKMLSKDARMTDSLKRIFTINLSAFHLQLVLGLILYFISPKVQFNEFTMKDTLTRFFTVEHAVMMVIAAVLITVGNARMKRFSHNQKKFRTVFVFNLLALIIVLLMIPWPFRGLGAGWF